MTDTTKRRRRVLGTLCALACSSLLASASGATAANLAGASEKRCTLSEQAAGQTCTDLGAWRTR